jgi:hypothetical protein
MRRSIRPICPLCSYDLTGAMNGRDPGVEHATCSECGKRVDLRAALMHGANLRPRRRAPGWLAASAVLVVMAGLLLLIARIARML